MAEIDQSDQIKHTSTNDAQSSHYTDDSDADMIDTNVDTMVNEDEFDSNDENIDDVTNGRRLPSRSARQATDYTFKHVYGLTSNKSSSSTATTDQSSRPMKLKKLTYLDLILQSIESAKKQSRKPVAVNTLKKLVTVGIHEQHSTMSTAHYKSAIRQGIAQQKLYQPTKMVCGIQIVMCSVSS